MDRNSETSKRNRDTHHNSWQSLYISLILYAWPNIHLLCDLTRKTQENVGLHKAFDFLLTIQEEFMKKSLKIEWYNIIFKITGYLNDEQQRYPLYGHWTTICIILHNRWLKWIMCCANIWSQVNYITKLFQKIWFMNSNFVNLNNVRKAELHTLL